MWRSPASTGADVVRNTADISIGNPDALVRVARNHCGVAIPDRSICS
ncbi:MAG: hypothetical protein WA964_14970 [Ilumatobacter sp.]